MKKMSRINLNIIKKLIFTVLILFFIYGVFILFSSDVYANSRISNVIVTSYGGDKIVLYFKVKRAFDVSLKKAILSGLPVKFRFNIRILSRPSMTVIYNRMIINKMTYDDLNNYFIIKYYYNKNNGHAKVVIKKAFNSALKLMSRVDDLVISIPSGFKTGHKYLIVINGVLGTVKLPFPFDYIPFINNYFQITTNTYRLKFIY